ncbi:cytochrome P450 [Streptomyces sp. NBC_00683]|uniref:cytochrome P450 n=1 Tax=Streptomyces sp. NBC_00683 TaxID=2903670 RepID=UPI002E34E298|nr:cytochrome P450 [Streptomyces sp. NBC_00683]
MTTLPTGPGTPPPGCPAHQAVPGQDPASGLPVLYGAEFAADPHATYERLRKEGVAHPVELAPGVEAVLITGYETALEVLRSPYFSKDARRWTALAEGKVPADNQVVPMMGWRPSLWFADGERHLRLRASVDDALGRVNPHQLRAYVQRSAGQLIDRFEHEGRADLVSQYADPIPALVFAQLFGCPDELTSRMAAACVRMMDAEPAVAQAGGGELAMCLGELIAMKRASPGADVTTWLLDHPSALSDEEMIHQLVVLIGAGTVPQSAWIATGTMMLLADDRFASDLTGGSLTVADALNEVLWLHSPLSNFSFVYAVHDHTLRDRSTGAETAIRAGVPVLISHAAANTDPVLDIGAGQRAANTSHLAFGAGPHACPARDTAGVIAEVAVEMLLDRLPDMVLEVDSAELTWRPGPFHRSLTALPVRFDAVRATSTQPPVAAVGEPTWNPEPAPSSIPPAQTSTRKPPVSEPRGLRRWWNSLVGSRPGR